MNLQKIDIIGRLGKDPEFQYTPSGSELVEFSVAVNTYTKGEKDPDPTWYTVTLFGASATQAVKLMDKAALAKGSAVFVSGDYRQKLYTTRNGATRVDNKVQATVFRLLEREPTD